MRIVVSYRGAPRICGWETGAMIARGFRTLGHEVFEYGNIYQTQIRLPNAPDNFEDIDLWLYCEMNDADPQYHEVKNIRARKLACALYDTSYYPDHLTSLQQYFQFDTQFIANPRDLGYFPNAFHMPYACDEWLHFRDNVPKQYGATLVGSDRQDRRALQSLVQGAGLTMDIVSGLFREQYIDALAASEFVINQNPNDGAGLFNMRQFEAPAAGSIIFTEGRDYDANEGEFEHMVNCVVYRNAQDIVDFIHILNDDPSAKENLRIAGQNHVLKHHTYVERCREILLLMFPHEVI